MSLEFAEQRLTSMYMSPKSSTYMIRLGLVFQLKLLWFLLLYKNQNTLLGIVKRGPLTMKIRTMRGPLIILLWEQE